MVNRLTALGSKWWFGPIAIFAATRIVSTFLFLLAASLQGENYWTKASPNYFDFLNIWDVEWYWRVFDHGYPNQLPTNADGTVQQNEWAFLPAFPLIVRLLSFTGIEWKYLAPAIALIFAFVASLLLYKLMIRYTSNRIALWAVAFFGLWMTSPVLQAGYAESLGLAALAATLLLVDSKKYLLALIPTAVLAYSRPGALAVALMLALIFADRWWYSRSNRENFTTVEQLKLAAATAVTGLLGLAWSGIAWAVTGRPDAYLATELAWRSGYTGTQSFQPFVGWPIGFNWLVPGPLGVLLLVVLLALVVYSLFWRDTISLGLTMRSWVAAYWGYLFVFFFPQSSTFRILMPLLPMFGVMAIAGSRATRSGRVLLVILLIALQLWWLLECWRYTAPDYTPP